MLVSFSKPDKGRMRVTDWIHKIQTLGSQFREAALLNCSEGAGEGILDLVDRLRNICFIQGLASDRIQTIVRSRNYQNFDEVAETALVEESAIASRQDRYRLDGHFTQRCGNCGKTGHASNKCYMHGSSCRRKCYSVETRQISFGRTFYAEMWQLRKNGTR